MTGHRPEKFRVRLLQDAQNGKVTVQGREHRFAEFFGTGLRRAQLVHQQDVPVTVTQGRRAQRVEPLAGISAAVEQQILRRGRSACRGQQMHRGPVQHACYPHRAEAAGCMPGQQAARQRGLAHALVTGEEQVVSAWGSHGVPPLPLRAVRHGRRSSHRRWTRRSPPASRP